MNLYEAIYARHSVHNYRMEPVEDKILKGIPEFIESLNLLFPEIKTTVSVIENIPKRAKIKGIANVTAPYYLAVYSEKKEKSDMNAGFIMQQISLFFTSKGIGSCFQGMARVKDKKMEDLGLEFVIMMAFGLPRSSSIRYGNEAKRLSIDELCVFKEHPKSWIREMIEAARLAPSSFNSQPWRFVVYENRIHVFSKKPVISHNAIWKYNELNFGIMLANVMVASEELWIDVDLIKINNITHKTIPNNQYVISILAKP